MRCWFSSAGLGCALFACLGLGPASATVVIVPDDAPTVQAAIDSGADTVHVRDGSYAERPVVDRAMVLQGIGSGPRPRLEGLMIYNRNFWRVPQLLQVDDVHFTGAVHHANYWLHPRGIHLSFTQCRLDSGFSQGSIVDIEDLGVLTFRNCRLSGGCRATLDFAQMEEDTISGGVSWETPWVSILRCWFTGGPGGAIDLVRWARGAISQNRIEGYEFGIKHRDVEQILISENVIRRCGVGIDLGFGSDADILANDIRMCGYGIKTAGTSFSRIRENVVLAADWTGIWTQSAEDLDVYKNVVGNCGDAGISVSGGRYRTIVGSNTAFRNGAAGIRIAWPWDTVRVERNIGFENRGWGVSVEGGDAVRLACNDWFGNTLGSVNVVLASPPSLKLDPLFCGVDTADVRLDSASPLASWPGCGQIGALGVGCGETPTLLQRFTAARVTDGIRVIWQVADGSTASEIRLERSEAGEWGGWSRPPTERSVENGVVIELDRSALRDRPYWYRLVALEGGEASVIGGPSMVEVEARPESRLTEVGPNPGSGPVRIGFSLEREAVVEIDVFDVQGRRVASLGRGTWPAGLHVVEWDGRMRGGEPAPAGAYTVRYLYPGGQDKRSIVRIR